VVVAGSSAGAMVLGDRYFDPRAGGIFPGLGLLAGVCVLPHHNRWGAQWAKRLRARLPETLLLGIDEETGLINEGPGDRWRVYGGGGVTCYDPRRVRMARAGETLFLRREEV
jgi:cyanophycinase-like exopeptidase